VFCQIGIIWFTGFFAVLGFGHGIAVSMEFAMHEGSYFYARLALCIVSVVSLTFEHSTVRALYHNQHTKIAQSRVLDSITAAVWSV
jgi:hypothetical protein